MTSRILSGGGGTGGRVLVADTFGNGDYSTIQAALDAANAEGASESQQWLVLVSPGNYQESLTLYDYVNLAGLVPGDAAFLNATGSSAIATVATCTVANLRISCDTTPAIDAGVAASLLTLRNIVADDDDDTVNFLKATAGTLKLFGCEVQVGGTVLKNAGATLKVYDSILRNYHINAAAAAAPTVDIGSGVTHLVRSTAENTTPKGAAVRFTAAPTTATLLTSIFRHASGSTAIDADLAVTAAIANCLGTGGVHSDVSGVISYTEDSSI